MLALFGVIDLNVFELLFLFVGAVFGEAKLDIFLSQKERNEKCQDH
jgi:hypothetical protein